jgi:hypothetical protein
MEGEEKGGQGKGGDGGVLREEKGRGGRKRGGQGVCEGGQSREWGKELWRTTFECLPPHLLPPTKCYAVLVDRAYHDCSQSHLCEVR